MKTYLINNKYSKEKIQEVIDALDIAIDKSDKDRFALYGTFKESFPQVVKNCFDFGEGKIKKEIEHKKFEAAKEMFNEVQSLWEDRQSLKDERYKLLYCLTHYDKKRVTYEELEDFLAEYGYEISHIRMQNNGVVEWVKIRGDKNNYGQGVSCYTVMGNDGTGVYTQVVISTYTSYNLENNPIIIRDVGEAHIILSEVVKYLNSIDFSSIDWENHS